MMTFITRFANDESGATAIEYGLIAMLLSAAIIVGALALGTNLGAAYNSIAAKVSTAAG